MEMKAKSSRIRKLRTERLWSQDQLAEVSGLGLRTIQRLESRGSGSNETIKALAAVFEVDPSSLVWRDGEFQCYKHRQWGLVTLAVTPLLATGFLALGELLPIPAFAMGIVFGVLTILTVMFSSMTIEVTESEIRWFFGPGLFRKQISLEEVGEYKKVRNPWWMGFGIHAFGTGWIYNVSGMLGVEIELKGGSFIRLGSDEPNYLVQAIEDAIDNLES